MFVSYHSYVSFIIDTHFVILLIKKMSLKINFIFQVFAIVFSLSLIFLLLKIFALLIKVNIFFFVYQFISRMDCLYEKKLFISFLYIFIYFAKHSMISFQWHWQMFSDFSSCVSYSSYYSFFLSRSISDWEVVLNMNIFIISTEVFF